MKKTDYSNEHTITSCSGVSYLDNIYLNLSQSLTFDEMQLLLEVSNTAYNSEFNVYIKIKLLLMKIILGMQIKKSERHSNSALD